MGHTQLYAKLHSILIRGGDALLNLGRDASIDPLVEGTVLSFVGREVLLVFLEHFLIILRESRDVVDVLD